MYIVRELGAKGQLVVPKDIRDHFGLKKGSKVVFEVKDDKIIIKPQKNEEFIDTFCHTVEKKLKKRIDIKELYSGQIEERDIL